MLFIIVWILLGLVTAFAAHQKGRSVAGWFIFGFLIPPLALIFILVSPSAQHNAIEVTTQDEHEVAPPMSERLNAVGGYVAWGLLIVGIIVGLLMMIEP